MASERLSSQGVLDGSWFRVEMVDHPCRTDAVCVLVSLQNTGHLKKTGTRGLQSYLATEEWSFGSQHHIGTDIPGKRNACLKTKRATGISKAPLHKI